MNDTSLRAIGWKSCFQQQVDPDLLAGCIIVRVSAHYGSQVMLLNEQGEFAVPVALAEAAGEIAVGDWLLVDAENHRAKLRLERDTFLTRKAAGEEVKPQAIAANIDTIFIVSSCNEDFSLSRIERYLAITLQAGAVPVVVLTKSDLCDDVADLRRQTERLHPGLLVESLDARDPAQVEVLTAWCRPGQTVALLGSSGVGKSTLANGLGAGNLATSAIREQDGKGRHTTTARSLHLLPNGGVLLDTPGMRELQLPACEDGIAELFDDVFALAEQCRFADCQHKEDAGCAVTAALDSGELDARRYHNFLKLNAEQNFNSRSLAERRERDRKTGRFYKSVMAEKRRRRDMS